MARRGKPPKQAQTLFGNGDGITASPPVAIVAYGLSDNDLLKMASEPGHIVPLPYGAEVRFARKLKIAVYAIAKNEAKFAARWMDSMKEADEIAVLDTGSTDDTVGILTSLGAKVERKVITPWRFDAARNESIKLVSPDADILVCTDIDEYFLPGWRAKLEAAWIAALDRGENPTTAQYEYVWGFNPDGSDGTKFWYEKIHARGSGAQWTHPVHEVLSYPGGSKRIVRVDGMRLEHHADPAKSRSQYLPLLEMSVRECPDDDSNTHYLGREYMFRGMWDRAIETLRRHLKLKKATWRAERAASMRYIARCYGEKNDLLRQEIWLWRAIHEEPGQREAALELAEFAYGIRDWNLLCRVCEACLAVKERRMSYLTKADAWGARPHDLYACGLWYAGRRDEAIRENEEAMRIAPNDLRLKANDRIMREAMAKAAEG